MTVIAFGSFAYLFNAGMPIPVHENDYSVTMSVSDTNGLVVGSPVLLRGIPIGSISKVSSSVAAITVEWNFNKKYRIPADSAYRVDNLSALGESYLAVVPAHESGPYLSDHSVVETTKVVVPTTIKELSVRLTRMLEQVDPARIGEIFREMNIALPEDVQVLGNLSHAGELLAIVVTRQSDALSKLLSALQPLLLDSAWMPGDLAQAGQGAPATGLAFSRLYDSFDRNLTFSPLVASVRDGTGPFLAELQKFLDNNAADLHTLGVDLLPAARAGAASLMTVNVGQLLDNALAAADSGDSITLHVRTPGR
ncbi:MlaD family protein [Nocardia sp. NPDC052278]|uniref:MlaD family protein n=1 Tax=unclassified Nocardia TaxID=2637762 RepID=UPI0036772039